jgi:hypothetical protein
MYIHYYIYPLVIQHSHGKSPFLIGKPSISMGHLYHGYVSHNQRRAGGHRRLPSSAGKRQTGTFGGQRSVIHLQMLDLPQ